MPGLALCLASCLLLLPACNRKEPEPPSTFQSDSWPGQQEPAAPHPVAELDDTEDAARADSSPATAGEGQNHSPLLAGGSNREESNALFERPTLLRIDIQIPELGIRLLRRTQWDRPERPVVKAIVREGGAVYRDVAVHVKGSVGSFRSIDDRPSLTLKFDKFITRQRFHGLNKISLNNSEQDSSYLCEKIGRELFLAASVPVPRASHAIVTLNGRDLGLYVLLEGANKQFVKRHFTDASGNLFDGGFCSDIGNRLSVNCGDDPNNYAGLKALRSAVRNPSYEQLQRVLDVDRFLTMVALEMMTCHWDGYTLNKNNWRVFHDLQSNRMVFVPHGMDQLFGAGRQFDPDGSIVPQQTQGQVSRAVLATREGRKRYLELVDQVYRNVFNVEQIAGRIDEIVAGIGPELAESHPQLARSFRQRANSLKSRVIRRGAGLRQQLGATIEPVEFSRDGVFPLTEWKPSLVQSGEPLLEEKEDEGKRLLCIRANGASSASWRRYVPLAPGKYEFQGKLRVFNVTITEGDARSGAGLRISKGPMPRKLTGSSTWTEFNYAFEVDGRGAEVELVCELKATAGEARFDAASLRLVQVP